MAITTTKAAATGATRPVAVPPSSSERPDSSSARVCRTTSTTASIATKTDPIPPSLIIEIAPIDVGSYTRPNTATSACDRFRLSAAASRSTGVG